MGSTKKLESFLLDRIQKKLSEIQTNLQIERIFIIPKTSKRSYDENE